MKIRASLLIAVIVTSGVAAPLPVTVTLRDGTRLIGRAAPVVVPVHLGAQVVTNLPLEQIRSVTRMAEDGALLFELGHGAALRGRVQAPVVALDTALGPVELAWAVVEELQVETPTGDVTWLTAAGAPGVQQARGGEMVLSGGRTWTRQRFRAPLVVEGEVMLTSRVPDGSGWFEMALVAEAKQRGTPERPVSVRLVYGALSKEGMQDGVVLRQMNTAQNTTRRPGEPPFVLAPGAWHRVRWEVRGDLLRFELNGRTHELGGVHRPSVPVALELSSRDAATRWRVRDFTVRGSSGPAGCDVEPGRSARSGDSVRELTDWLTGTFLGRPAF